MHDGNFAGKSCFLVGIGGSGMMPLAMILRARGATVAGSDRSLDQGRLAPKFDDLRQRGIALFPQDGSGISARDQIVIASAAVEDTVPDIRQATALGCERLSRAQVLASLFNDSAMPIGIAGTSGKSTVTGMIGWILNACDRDPTVMNGAVMKNFAHTDTPFASALVGSGEAFVSEVDESDGSIALYRPQIAVLNNVSLDHKSLDELRTLFTAFASKARTAIVNIGDPEAAALAVTLPHATTFAVNAPADFMAEHLVPSPFAIAFDLVSRGERHAVRLNVPGEHNVANALAALAAVTAAGVPLADAITAIEEFQGLRRRFDFVGEANGVRVIDDFGHNPDKIAATLSTLHMFPGRVLVLFQPHGFGPLKVMRRELADTFARQLHAGDVLVMPDPVFQGGTVAREVTSEDIIRDVAALGADARYIPDRRKAAETMVEAARPGDRIIVMGARDDSLSALAADILAALAG